MDAEKFGELIFQLRESVLSRAEMARLYPWHVNTILAYEKQGRLPDTDYLAALSYETKSDYVQLIRQRVQAGILAEEHPNVIGWVEAATAAIPGEHPSYVTAPDCEPGHMIMERAALYDPEHKRCAEIDDDAMEPTLPAGSVVQYMVDSTPLQDGKLYALALNDRTVIRRVQFGFEGELLLVADNRKFETLHLTKQQATRLKVLGKVCLVVTELD
ncbi:S24 family peptidase [Bowmanella denitrificans]|uniref:S24 family peptidase n=1 Tax=Bowmanella denitrificans TaxID=366582 RepID=UPI000C9C24A2|nr:S24 family peptidase [Bowmanella denitrificans]